MAGNPIFGPYTEELALFPGTEWWKMAQRYGREFTNASIFYTMIKQYFLLSALCVTLSLFHKVYAQNQPNIIVILADDLGYGDLSCYGSEKISTPNIDRLAAEGVKLTNFYANAPECTPTRTAFLTGRYQQRIGGLECAIGAGNVGRYDEAMWLAERHLLGLSPQYSVLPKALKSAGYQTAITGKWHLGYEPQFRPFQHGFDYAIGCIGYGGDYFYHTEQVDIAVEALTGSHNLARNDQEIFRDGYYMTHLITDEAREWINRQKEEQPFFLYIPYTAPHVPLQGPDDFQEHPAGEEAWKIRDTNVYRKMIEDMDRGIGEILEMLDRKGMSENTVVIFFSDNGPIGVGSAGPLSGHKGQVYEGGIRVPCIVKWPGKIAAGTVSDQASIGMDLTYSILDLAGADVNQYALDGFDLIHHLSNQDQDMARTLFWRKKRGESVLKAVRQGDMKYLAKIDGGTVKEEKLFNLATDVSEKDDLKDKEPDVLSHMRKLLEEWEQEVQPQWLVSQKNKQ